MNRSFGLWNGFVAMSLLGQPASSAVGVRPAQAQDLQGAEARLKIASALDTQAANLVLKLAAKKDIKSLEKLSRSGATSNERLFAGYLLYCMDPHSFRSTFVRVFPESEHEIQAFVGLDLPVEPASEVNQISHPGVEWPIGFWAIESAMLTCVKAAEPTAVHRFMLFEGKGDGEIGEGLADDIMDLYVHNPDLIVRYWDDFKNHLGFIDELGGWYEASEIQKARDAYKALLGPSDSRLSIILKHFDQAH